MDLIEQAVFTSAETDRSAGYQVVATSPGVGDTEALELSLWGPSHDALLESSPSAASCNFHPLSSGNYCVSRTTAAGREYSGRGGLRVYTQCLIVSPQTLARFANNPFALTKAALAAGALRLYDEVPKQLETLRLSGRAAPVDSALLARLCSNPGPDWLATLVQAALASPGVAVVGGASAEHLIAGLINCLPPECRTEFSFSTGLKVSSRRPYRVVALSGNSDERHRAERLYDLAVLDFTHAPSTKFAPLDSWARFIQRVLKSGRTSLLSAHLSNRQQEFAPEDLHALGLQLLEELDATSMEDNSRTDSWWGQLPNNDPADGGPGVSKNDAPEGRIPSNEVPAGTECPSTSRKPPADVPVFSPDVGRADDAHHRFQADSRARSANKCTATAPSKHLDPDCPEVLAKLENLDDLVFEAIAGRFTAIEELKLAWPKVRDELGQQLLAESREQYLRYALSVWKECVESDSIHDPTKAIQALDVLSLLFDGV